jgi:hypothetical protein
MKTTLVLLLVMGGVVCGAPSQPTFTDITDVSGIAAIVSAHYAAHPSWWLSGLHLVDLDGDGDLDLFLSAHGRGDALAALNDGRGCFTPAAGSYPTSEITEPAGTTTPPSSSPAGGPRAARPRVR